MANLKSVAAGELLSRFVMAMMALERGVEGALENAQELRMEIMARMPPDGPPKTECRTEKTTFGKLVHKDKFLWKGWLHRCVQVSGTVKMGALSCEGWSEDIVAWPDADTPVEKIIEE